MTTLLKRWGVFAVLAALTGCGADDSPSEPGPSTTQDSGVDAPAPGPKIWVSADALDAGVLSCELSGANADARYQALKLVVRNDGDATLAVDDEGSTGVVPSYNAFTVEPGAKRTLHLEFLNLCCADGDLMSGTLVLSSNDPSRPKLEIPVSAKGALPTLKVSPDTLTWMQDEVPGVVSHQFTLENVGSIGSRIGDLAYDFDPGPFNVGLDLTASLAPKQKIGVGVFVYSPEVPAVPYQHVLTLGPTGCGPDVTVTLDVQSLGP